VQLVFIYGQAASGKLTVARQVAERTGLSLFHNHLVVDAVGAVFPFGSKSFVRLREHLWLEIIAEAARLDRSLIFTFAPEPTVAPDFAARVQAMVEAAGGKVIFVALTISAEEQERRIVDPSRAAFGKLRSLDLLRKLRGDFTACTDAMPSPVITIDITSTTAEDAACAIVGVMSAAAGHGR
jgi:hypothetical protein